MAPTRSGIRSIALLCLAGGAVGCIAGCTAVAFAAATVQAAKEASNVSVEAEYRGLDGHSFALIVTADRLTQAEFGDMVPRYTIAMNERLKNETLATGYIPPMDLLAYTYNNPRWVARPLGEVAAELGVDRLIVVEIQEYRLNEPGNRYIWDGTVLGSVGVLEVDSLVPDEFVFTKSLRVTFPDRDKNFTSENENMTGAVVASVLESRVVNRVTWLFYDHEEPYSIEY
jgi:hypothetical protein